MRRAVPFAVFRRKENTMRGIAILGSTGSIGRQAVDVIQRHPDLFSVTALTAHKNAELLFQQVRTLRPRLAAITGEKVSVPEDLSFCRFLFGKEALETVAREAEGQDVLAAVVGVAGLRAVMAARESGKRILLANKETLVSGGEMVMKACESKTGEKVLLPVDSEHSAIFQCLEAAGPNRFSRILLTASGGPFFGDTKEQLAGVTREQTLANNNTTQ